MAKRGNAKVGRAKKGGQISLEYMMIYAFAFLVIAVIIGYIYLTSIHNTTYTNSYCYITPSFPCQGMVVIGNSTNPTNLKAYIIFKNNQGTGIYVKPGGFDFYPNGNKNPYAGACIPSNIPEGGAALCNVSMTNVGNGISVGSQVNPKFSVSYSVCSNNQCTGINAASPVFNTTGTGTAYVAASSDVLYSIYIIRTTNSEINVTINGVKYIGGSTLIVFKNVRYDLFGEVPVGDKFGSWTSTGGVTVASTGQQSTSFIATGNGTISGSYIVPASSSTSTSSTSTSSTSTSSTSSTSTSSTSTSTSSTSSTSTSSTSTSSTSTSTSTTSSTSTSTSSTSTSSTSTTSTSVSTTTASTSTSTTSTTTTSTSTSTTSTSTSTRSTTSTTSTTSTSTSTTSTSSTSSTSTSTTSTSTIPIYSFTESANPPSYGSISPGSGSYSGGTVVSISATANTGHYFVSWSCTGTGCYSGTSASTSITMNNAITETANFAAYTYTLTVVANPSAWGSVSGGGTYNYNTSVSLSATADAGYKFTSWSCSGTCPDGSASTANPWTVTDVGTATYTAVFVSTCTGSVSYSNPGGPYEVTVPAGCSTATVAITGGGGGGGSGSLVNNFAVAADPVCSNLQSGGAGGSGGFGASLDGSFTVSPGQALYVWVGGGGAGNQYTYVGNSGSQNPTYTTTAAGGANGGGSGGSGETYWNYIYGYGSYWCDGGGGGGGGGYSAIGTSGSTSSIFAVAAGGAGGGGAAYYGGSTAAEDGGSGGLGAGSGGVGQFSTVGSGGGGTGTGITACAGTGGGGATVTAAGGGGGTGGTTGSAYLAGIGAVGDCTSNTLILAGGGGGGGSGHYGGGGGGSSSGGGGGGSTGWTTAFTETGSSANSNAGGTGGSKYTGNGAGNSGTSGNNGAVTITWTG